VGAAALVIGLVEAMVLTVRGAGMPALVIAGLSWQPGGGHCSQAGLAQRPEPHWIPVSERLCIPSLGGGGRVAPRWSVGAAA